MENLIKERQLLKSQLFNKSNNKLHKKYRNPQKNKHKNKDKKMFKTKSHNK